MLGKTVQRIGSKGNMRNATYTRHKTAGQRQERRHCSVQVRPAVSAELVPSSTSPELKLNFLTANVLLPRALCSWT